jgi:predicted ATPase
LPALNTTLATELGATVSQQIGVNTGEVIAGDASLGQRLVTGDAVNVAARLEQAAGSLDVLMGELTHRLVRDAVTVEPVEPLHLKGKSEAVPAYRLLSVSRAVEGFRRRQDTPMVGREAEMASLSEIMLRARNERAGRMATIVADAGTGKSRLIREFVDACDTTSIVLRGKCLPYGEGITFWPLVEAARGVAHIDVDDTPEQGVAKLQAVVNDRAVVDRIASAIGLTREQFGVPEIVWATRKMLETLAADKTAIWVIDDIHWAEQTLLDLIVYLLEHAEAPVLLLCSSRPDLLEIHPDWALRPDSVRLILKPLTDADAAQVVHNLLGKAGIAGDVEQRIVAAAEGNPLYVEQMLSMLIDSGRVRKVGDSWEPTVDLSQMAIPPTIQALLSARLDLLSQDERSVIEPASVIGMEFEAAAVEELSPAPVRSDISSHLQVMTRKQLVRRSTSNLEEAMFRFAHILIKDAAYGGLLKRARAQLHERFVAWATRVNRERGRTQEYEEIQGYHLEQAYRYLAELGPIDEHGREVGARASDMLASAGRRAQARGDAPAAVNLLRRAAATRTLNDPQRLPLLPDLAQALRELGEFGDALQVIREVRNASRQLGDERLEAKAHLIQLFIEQYTGESEDGREWTTAVAEEVESALPIFERTGDEDGIALAWRLRAGIHVMANRYGEMAASLEQVVRHARIAGDLRTETRSAYATAYALVNGPTPVDEGIARCEELERHSESDQSAVAIIKSQLGQLHAMRGEFDRARELCRSARSSLQDFGNDVLAASTEIDAASIEMRAGDYAAAERELRRAHDSLSAMGEKFLLSTISGLLARMLTLQGRLDEAEPLLASMAEIAAPDDVDAQAILRGVRARILAARGEYSTAIQLTDEAVALRRESDSIVEQGIALWDRAEILRLAGDERGAGASLAEALELLERKGDLALAERVRSALSVPAA